MWVKEGTEEEGRGEGRRFDAEVVEERGSGLEREGWGVEMDFKQAEKEASVDEGGWRKKSREVWREREEGRTCDGRVGFDRMKKSHDFSSWVVPYTSHRQSSRDEEVSYYSSDEDESE